MIPFDAKSVAAATNVGRPVVEGRGKVAEAIQQLTDRVAGNPAASAKPRRLRLWPMARR